jgi:hypothetical protein
MHLQTKEKGITLLITLLLMGVLLGVSTSLMNITMKQYQLSGIALSSEVAFQAANAGLECILYHDFPALGDSPFTVPDDGGEQAARPQVACMDGGMVQADDTRDDDADGLMKSGEEQLFEFTWGVASASSAQLCSKVSVHKFSDADNPVSVVVEGRDYRNGSDCPAGSVCTVVQARGYNVACGDISSNSRVVEREYTQVY